MLMLGHDIRPWKRDFWPWRLPAALECETFCVFVDDEIKNVLAAYSLGGPDLTDEQQKLVRQWRDTIAQIRPPRLKFGSSGQYAHNQPFRCSRRREKLYARAVSSRWPRCPSTTSTSYQAP